MAKLTAKEEKTRQRQAQSLQWIANPFIKSHHAHHVGSSTPPSHEGKGHSLAPASPTLEEELEEHEEIEEATPIELFYDLYFVANLTTVTSVHYINENSALSSYILYFIILWFTWLHVTLLDVRFSVDSVYERVCKGLHFATMAAFASVSAQWDPFQPDSDLTVRALKTMTLTLMFSRAVLGLQYLVVMLFGLRTKKSVVAPLAIQGVSMLVSAAVYLGVYFTFGHGNESRSYIAWYIMAIFEVAAVVVSSSIWTSVCFRKTHIIERMGLLTLIILGEGIIVMLKAINTIVKGFGWTQSTFGVVFAALAIIYLFWMLYFDMSPKHAAFGRKRQQLWTILHFPFHLAIVLSVEGLRQLSALFNATFMYEDLFTKFITAPLDEAMIRSFNETFELFKDDVYAKTVLTEWPTIKNYTGLLSNILDGSLTIDYPAPGYTESDVAALVENAPELRNTVSWAYYLQGSLVQLAEKCLFEFYGMKLVKPKADSPDSPLKQLFDLVYKYFFIALGVIFVLYSVFTILARRQIDVFDIIAVILRLIPAAVFFGMSVIPPESSFYNYSDGAWPIPQICALIFAVVLADKVANYFALKRG